MLLRNVGNIAQLTRRYNPGDLNVPLYRMSIKSFPDYKHFLQENYVEYKYVYFLPLLKLVSKIFQQDGAPPQCGSHVRRFLDATFPNRWIGRDGPTPWPPQSPDIPPSQFTSFYGGMLRTKCFRHQFQILQI